MKRMQILAALLLSLGLSFNSFAAEKKIVWRLAATWGPTLHPFIDTPKNFAKLVNEMSDGNFVIKIDASNVHKSPFGVFDMVKGAQYHMGHSFSYYWAGKDAALIPFSTVPFGLTAGEIDSWFYYSDGLALMQKVYSKYGLLSFPGGNTSAQMGGWFRKEIKTVKDLKGIKMRIPGVAGQVLTKLGVVTTNIAPGELYTALDRGTIDAVEWVGPGMDIALGFQKVANYYYTGWHEPGAESQFLINKKAWDKLPKKYQAIVKAAIRVAAHNMTLKNNDMSGKAWMKMLKESPQIKVKTFSKGIMDAIKKANKEVISEISAKNPLFKEIMESQMNYKKVIRPWTIMSEYEYLKSDK